MVTFSYPGYLVLALVLVLGFLLVSLLTKRFQETAIGRFGRRQTLERFSRFTRKRVLAVVISAALASLAIAAAGPKLESRQTPFSPTLNAIIVLDVSRSMLAEDGLADTSRLESAVVAVEKLLDAYPDGRFGLVLFTSRTIAYPPTLDSQAIRIILRDVLENFPVRGEGSEPVSALEIAGKLIGESDLTVNTILLISDGGRSLSAENSEPQSTEVTGELRKQGIRVVAVGVGGLVPVTIPVYEDGEFIGYHRYQGTVVYTALDVVAIKRFADQTSGLYLRLTGPDDLVRITRSANLDTQPVAQEASISLVWIPTVFSIILVALWLLYPRIS